MKWGGGCRACSSVAVLHVWREVENPLVPDLPLGNTHLTMPLHSGLLGMPRASPRGVKPTSSALHRHNRAPAANGGGGKGERGGRVAAGGMGRGKGKVRVADFLVHCLLQGRKGEQIRVWRG